MPLLAKGRAVTIIFSISFLLLGSLPTYIQAQSKAKKHKQSINFEDELIQGEVKGTDLLYLLSRKQFNYKKLIKLRKDFLPEMRRFSGECGARWYVSTPILLCIYKGEQLEGSWEFSGSQVIIGRGADVHLELSDERVSPLPYVD